MYDHTTMLPVIPVAEAQTTERRGADLSLWRVLLALAMAPLFGAALMTSGIYFASVHDDALHWQDVALSLLSPSAWSLICGLTYLRTIARMRDQIARHECLLLGGFSSLLLPLVVDIAGTVLLQGSFPAMDWNHIKVYAFAGLFSLPFGLFGGWVFWRIGVRPAKLSLGDCGPVFD